MLLVEERMVKNSKNSGHARKRCGEGGSTPYPQVYDFAPTNIKTVQYFKRNIIVKMF